MQKEGFAIVVSFPKGHVHEPTQAEKIKYLLQDNYEILVLSVTLIVTLIFYVVMWLIYGKDPKAGVIIPEYSPPQGLRASHVRYLKNMKFDNKTLVVEIIQLATKGFIKIIELESGSFFSKASFLLERTDKNIEELSSTEQNLIEEIFRGGLSLELENTYYKRMRNAKKILEDDLKSEFKGKKFVINEMVFYLGTTLSAVGVVLVFKINILMGVLLWVLLFLVGVILGHLLIMVVSISMTFFIIAVYFSSSPLMSILILALGLINYVFYKIMPAPTREGRRLMDKIDGFKLYLSVAEKDRLDFVGSPDLTLELFEEFLPYAVALDVDHQWAKQFEEVIIKSFNLVEGQKYSPDWYDGINAHNFYSAEGISNFNSAVMGAVVASSLAPGSSSGDGGGSSGGGGGGGGGGGW